MRTDGINNHLIIRYYATLSEDTLRETKGSFQPNLTVNCRLLYHVTDHVTYYFSLGCRHLYHVTDHVTDYFSTRCCHLTKTVLKDKMRRIFKDHYRLFHKRLVRTKFDIYMSLWISSQERLTFKQV